MYENGYTINYVCNDDFDIEPPAYDAEDNIWWRCGFALAGLEPNHGRLR